MGGIRNRDELANHVGHEIDCIGYDEGDDGSYDYVAIECLTCTEVLFDFDDIEELVLG